MGLKWKKISILGLMLLMILSGCVSPENQEKDPNKLQVYTTLYPLEYFAALIGGEHIQVTNLVPIGVEVHDFEPSAKDYTKLADADLFIYNGIGLEPWIEKLENVMDPKKTHRLDASKNISPLRAEDHKHDDHHHENRHQGNVNPHVWLDPKLAKSQALAIQKKLTQLDPKHRTEYEKNYQRLANRLDRLDREFVEIVQQAKKKKFVVSHDAFGYLAKRYGLHQIAISGLSPSDEPSPKELETIIDTVKKHQLKYIFVEPLSNSRVAKTVQKEAKVGALVLHPLEGIIPKEVEAKEDYFSLMRKNLNNLAKALESKR